MSVAHQSLALTMPRRNTSVARKIYCGKLHTSVSDSREMRAGHRIMLTLCSLRSASQ